MVGDSVSSNVNVHHYIDVLVIDIFMAEMDGIALIREVRNTYPKLWIVAMSDSGGTFGHDYVMTAAGALGADRVLSKPFLPPDLLAAIAAKESR